MHGGKHRYVLYETVYLTTEDETSLAIPTGLRSGWRGSESYTLMGYKLEEGIGSRIVSSDHRSILGMEGADRIGFYVSYWDHWPSDKDLSETIYGAERLGR